MYYQSLGIGGWVQRSKERRRTRQIAFSLCDIRLEREGIRVVRCNIENAVKLSQRFGKTTKVHIGKCVLGQQRNVARVAPLGFVEVTLALVPLAAPPCEIGQRFRNPAAIGQEWTCLFEVMHRGVVILQAGVVVLSPGYYGFAEIGLKAQCGFGRLSRFFTQSDGWLKILCALAARIDV